MFAERWGDERHESGRGRPPREYWSYEIGHILPAISRVNIGTLAATDLLGAARLFDAKYRPEEE